MISILMWALERVKFPILPYSNANYLTLEKWKQCIDKGASPGAVLTYLSKAFDCLSHDLLIAKLKAYGLATKHLN